MESFEIILFTIAGMLIFLAIVSVYRELKFKFSKECRNCGKITEVKHAILCDDCVEEYNDILPKDWGNKK